jgi:hypothetical protein
MELGGKPAGRRRVNRALKLPQFGQLAVDWL